MNKAVTKYIQHYQEAEAAQFQNTLLEKFKNKQQKFDHLLCLPCYAEPIEHLEHLLIFLTKHQNTLLIIVLNQPDNLDREHQQDNQQINQQWLSLLDHSGKGFKQEYSDNTFSLYQSVNQNDNNAVLLVDRFTKLPIPHKQGVGLARKIGADIAMTLFAQGLCETRWLHNIDADVKPDKDYFSATEVADKNAAAIVYPFKHIDGAGNAVSLQSPDKVNIATAVYEKRLLQYQQGLAYAGSQYAFHTVGSCIALSLEHYPQARGFPKQSAGEDFYLLNKLRKLGNIISLDKPLVKILSRESERTPFGTGAAVCEILKYSDPRMAPIFYHPRLYDGLKLFITWLERLANDFETFPITSWQQDLNQFSEKDWGEHIVIATEAIGFNNGITHCQKQAKDKQAFTYQLFCWFDGFKTLKWIHALRDSYQLGMLSLSELSDSF